MATITSGDVGQRETAQACLRSRARILRHQADMLEEAAEQIDDNMHEEKPELDAMIWRLVHAYRI